MCASAASAKGKILGMTSGQALLFSCVLLAMLLPSLDQTIVAVAMPSIASDLGGVSMYGWVFTAYMIALAISSGLSGKLGDMFGRKKVYATGVIIFILGSALCGFSQSMDMLILLRAFQGLGGGIMIVSTIAIVGEIFPPSELGKYQGFLGAVYAVASILGPVLGAFILATLDWRWIFYVNVPVAALVLILLYCAKYPSPKPRKHSLDVAGALYFSLFIISFMVYLSSDPFVLDAGRLLLLGGSALFLFLFLREEKSAKEPVIELSLFRNRNFALAIAAAFLTALLLFGVVNSFPMLLQEVVGVSAKESSNMLTVCMLAFILSSAAGGWAISATGKYRLLGIISCAVASIGMLMLALIGAIHPSQFFIIAAAVVFGLGLGPTMPLFIIIVQNSFGKPQLGMVSAILSLFRTLGGAMSGAIVSLSLGVSGGTAPSLSSGLLLTFAICFALSLPAIAIVWMLGEKPLKKKWGQPSQIG